MQNESPNFRNSRKGPTQLHAKGGWADKARPSAYFVALAIILFAAPPATAKESEWQWLNRDPRSTSFQQVHIYDKDTWYFTMRKGQILETKDAGKNWFIQTLPTRSDIWGIDFVSENIGFASGADGLIFTTADGGKAWKQVFKADDVFSFYGFAALNANTILAGGGDDDSTVIVRSADGGTTWSRVSHPRLRWGLNHIVHAGGDTVFASGSTGILRSLDAGATWTLSVAADSVLNLRNIHEMTFVDSRIGYATGDGTHIIKTVNAGETWQKFAVNCEGCSASRNILALDFLNANEGWVLGSFPLMGARTKDGGSTWEKLPMTDVRATWAQTIAMTDSKKGMLLANSVYYLTEDGGETWTNGIKGFDNHIEDMHFVDSTSGWLVGSGGGIQNTKDGGKTWKAQKSDVTAGLRSVYFRDAANGAAVGLGGTLLLSENGGETWSKIETGVDNDLMSVQACGEGQWLAVGASGQVLKRKASDLDKSNPYSFGLNSVTCHGAQAWVAGDSGNIIHSSNGGTDWKKLESGVLFDIFRIQFVDSLHGFAAGESDMLLATTDGGDKWEQIPLQFLEYQVSGMHFVDRDNGWISPDYSGSIYRTRDGGKNWNRIEPDDMTSQVPAIFFLDTALGFVGGVGGILKKYDARSGIIASIGPRAQGRWHGPSENNNALKVDALGRRLPIGSGANDRRLPLRIFRFIENK